MNADLVNITGHTSQIQAISHLGNDPDQWLLALRGLEDLKNCPRKRKLLQHFFVQSGKILDSASLRRSRSYAVLLGKEALFYGEIDVEDARRTFEMGLSMCQSIPVLYVMFAQFELDQGRKDKALKVLQHGQVCAENPSEIIAAKAKLDQGWARIDGTKEKHYSPPLKNITNEDRGQADSKLENAAQRNKVLVSEGQNLTRSHLTHISQNLNIPSHQAKDGQSRFVLSDHTSKPVLSTSHGGCLQSVQENDNPVISQAENVPFSNRCVHTPPQQRLADLVKSLDIGLMDSPASPNITFDLPTHHKPHVKSMTPSTDGHHQDLSKASNTSNPQDALSKSYLAPSLSIRSEKKNSPFSWLMQQRSQTTGKKAARIPTSCAPRRVLVTNLKSQLSDSDEDIQPIEKSPDDVIGSSVPPSKEKFPVNNPPTPKQDAMLKTSSSNDKDVPVLSDAVPKESVFPGYHPDRCSQPVSAFKPYPKCDQENHQSKLRCPSFEDSAMVNALPMKNLKETPCIQTNDQGYSAMVDTEEKSVLRDLPLPFSKTHFSGANKENSNPDFPPSSLASSNCLKPSGIRSRNPSDSVSGNFAMAGRPSIQMNPDHLGQPRDEHMIIHPAHRLIMEKKIIEVNNVPYILLKLLGKGGSSKVYQVLDPKTSAIAAVKQVNLAGCETSVVDGYKNEINFLKKLQGNRYIIKLIDYEIREQHLYLVMECGSLDLSAFLKKQKLLNESLEMVDILAFWKNMLRAVEAIHKHGVIHLDLKPANFMLVDYTLKLIDFGIANSIQVDATSIIKDTQFGTLNYMAPETINDLSEGAQTGLNYEPRFKVGPKADVWSLGCILYYIMYGKTPFQHIHHQAMKLFAITNENHRINFPEFPRRELIEIVQACLTRDPKKRPSVEMLLNHPLLK